MFVQKVQNIPYVPGKIDFATSNRILRSKSHSSWKMNDFLTFRLCFWVKLINRLKNVYQLKTND